MIFELNHVKSEIKTKEFEVDELKKQVAELKAALEEKTKENEKNARCLKETRRQLGECPGIVSNLIIFICEEIS